MFQTTPSELPSPLREGVAYLESTTTEADIQQLLKVFIYFVTKYFNEDFELLVANMPEKLRKKQKETNFLTEITADDILPAYTNILTALWQEKSEWVALGAQYSTKLDKVRYAGSLLEKIDAEPIFIKVNQQEVDARPFVNFLLKAFVTSVKEIEVLNAFNNYLAYANKKNDSDAKVILNIEELTKEHRVRLYRALHATPGFFQEIIRLVALVREERAVHVWPLFGKEYASLNGLLENIYQELEAQKTLNATLQDHPPESHFYQILAKENTSAVARLVTFEAAKKRRAKIEGYNNECEQAASEESSEIERHHARELLKILDSDNSDLAKVEMFERLRKTPEQWVNEEIIILQACVLWVQEDADRAHIERSIIILTNKNLSLSERLKNYESNNEKYGQQYAAVAEGMMLKFYKLIENDYNELVFAPDPGTVNLNTTSETINTVTHYTANNEVYIALGVKSESGNARLLVYKIDKDGKIVDKSGTPFISIDLGSKTKINSIAPIVENPADGYGYFAVALNGDKKNGYVQQIKFYRFNMADNTYANINDDGNKVLGLNPKKLIYFTQDGKNHLVVVNKNNPAEYQVESQLLTFTISDGLIKVTDSHPIETFGAENGLHFTSKDKDNKDKSYIAFNETYAADSSQAPKSRIFSLDDGGSSVTKRVDLDFGKDAPVPYQTLTYSLYDANMQQYDYLMYVYAGSKASTLYQWDPIAQTVVAYGDSASAPEANGATVNWEFVKKGDNDYYLLAVKNQESSTALSNRVIETYQVTDR